MTDCYPEWYARDNAFRSVEWMEKLHGPIVDLARNSFGQSPGSVLDLGCGNAALLKSIVRTAPAAVPFGIDYDADSIAHAKLLLPEHAANFCCGNLLSEADGLWTPSRIFTVAIVMPGHLLSGPSAKIERLKGRLLAQCQHVIAYCYQDWILRFGSLQTLAMAAGLVVKPVFTGDRVATALLENICP